MAATTTSRFPDTKLTHPLARLRGYIRAFVLVDVLLFIGLFLIAWFALGITLDYGLFKLTGFDLAQREPDAYLRGTILFGFAFLLTGLVAWRTYGLFTKDFSNPSLALVLEKRHPEVLGDRLITAIELADVQRAAKFGYSAEMIEDTINQARERVDQVSLRGVFNWSRLVKKSLVLMLLAGVFLGTAFGLYATFRKSADPVRFGWHSADIVSIWAERNILLMKTPWPRRAYVEILTTDEDGNEVFGTDKNEMRLPEKAKPNIRVRVYQWVHADRNSYHGWRPLLWSDLTSKLLGFTPPTPSTTRTVGTKSSTIEIGHLTVDEIARLNSKGEVFVSTENSVDQVLKRLDEVAQDPQYSRRIRKLNNTIVEPEQPLADAVKPAYPLQAVLKGLSTSLPLIVSLSTRDAEGVYSGSVLGPDNNGIKESYSFVAQFEDFVTLPKTITAIPPPRLRELKQTQFHPAYLYHRAPTDGDQASLNGLYQRLPQSTISLNGEKSVLSVPHGSELELIGEADKPLSKVLLQTRTEPVQTFPLVASVQEDGTPSNDNFTFFRFDLKGANRLLARAELKLVMFDQDNVSSERLIDISVREDKGPEAELTVKYLRKVGNEYWITPKAMIPFENASSFARDELGLRTVRYYFTWRKVESQIIGQGRAQITLGLAQAVAAPFATLATPLTFSAYDRIINTYAAVSEKGLQTGSLDVGGFTENYERLPKRTLAELKKVLDVATLPQDLPADVRTYSFGSLTDVFDLGEETPGTPKLLQKDAIEAQPRYQIELFLEATDTNASVQTPSTTNPGQMVVGKVTRSLTPVRFLVVAEEDLFVKITEDEEKIGNTCENALKRAEDAQNKLLPELSQLGQLNVDPMQLESSAVRVIGILQDVGRVRDECQTMQADIVRVMNELDYNRFGQAAMNKWRNEYFESVRGLLSTEVPNAQSALNNFQTKLATNQPPTNVDISETRKAMTDLVAALVRTRKLFGDLESLQSKIKQLTTILNQQKEIQKEIADAKRRTEEELRQPKIFVDKQMTIKAGQKTTLTLPVQWGFYIAPKGELGIRVEPAPGSELKTPARIIAKDDRDDYKLEIEAGQKLGVTTIILTPDVGKPAELRVEVVK